MGGWPIGWVAGLNGNVAISAQLELKLGLSLAKIKPVQLRKIDIRTKFRLGRYDCYEIIKQSNTRDAHAR